MNIKNCKLWNIISIGKLVWLVINKKELQWVKWVYVIYIRANDDFWTHKSTQDNNCYWRKLHGIKKQMKEWYNNDSYCLTSNGKYFVSMGYIQLVGERLQWNTVALI